MQTKLTGKQRRHLRSVGHHLDPVVYVGKNQITDALVADLENALRSHELVKVRLQESVSDAPKDVAAGLAETTGAELVQVIGRTMLLFLQNEHEPKVTLPE